jgi:hypothetical protein
MLGAVCVSYFLLTFSTSSNANLVNGSILSIDSGSHFDLDSTGITPILGNDGLIVGTSQFASGSHSGLPDSSENPGIDNPWAWGGNTGMHLTTSPTVILNDDGAGNVLLDFSGWEWTWNLQTWNLGSGAWNGNPDGVALMTCASDCANGDAYALTYSATFPSFPSGLQGVQYRLSLTGVISSVPVPAAVWLFGSGLIGLIGVARREKA